MGTINVGFKRLDEDSTIPSREHRTDSGFDLYASEDVVVGAKRTKVISTGIAVELPDGYEAQVRPRSGITAKTKLRVQIGTIDNGYTGPIGIIVDNQSVIISDTTANCGIMDISGDYVDGIEGRKGDYLIKKGDKLAQLVVQEVPDITPYEIEGDMKMSERSSEGFGSTGYNNNEQQKRESEALISLIKQGYNKETIEGIMELAKAAGADELEEV